MNMTRMIVAIVAACLYAATARAVEVTVILSDGTKLVMQEPVDMMDENWSQMQSRLPAVFLLVSDEQLSHEEKIKQLLVTARVLGNLYVDRYNKAVGVTDEGVDMFKVEEIVEKERRGEVSPEVQKAIREGEVAAHWSWMIQDYARERGLAVPVMPPPNTHPEFLEKYFSHVSRGDSPEIYEEVLRRVAQHDPGALETYLQNAPAEKRETLGRILQTPSSYREVPQALR
jgi:hypothetical protein